jgi:hypothetical protein
MTRFERDYGRELNFANGRPPLLRAVNEVTIRLEAALLRWVELSAKLREQSEIDHICDLIADTAILLHAMAVAEAADVVHQGLYESLCVSNTAARVTQQAIIDQGQWRRTLPPNATQMWLHAIAEIHGNVFSPPPSLEPRKMWIEPLQTLVDQGVSRPQIALIAKWHDRFGRPDIERVERAILGQEQFPRFWLAPPVIRGPARRPEAGHLRELSTSLAESRGTVEAVRAALITKYDAALAERIAGLATEQRMPVAAAVAAAED